MPGKLIVFEGTDGSGKSTQFGLLCQRLEAEKYPFRRIVFPQYEKESSALIRMYLGGAFGSRPSDVNAYAASAFYAVDRFASYRQVWGAYYEAGGLVLADRYTTSNAVHQASKLPPEERPAFFRWLYEFEFDKMSLPRPDQVLYLDMPTAQAVDNLRRREAETRTRADIHEVDTEYLASCRAAALDAAEILGWTRIECVQNGRLRSVEALRQEIWTQVQRHLQAL